MITLIEAVKVCLIPEDESVYLRKRGSDRFNYTLLTPREMRNRLDMRAIKVHAISVRFEAFGPDFLGMEFEVSGWRRRKVGDILYDCFDIDEQAAALKQAARTLRRVANGRLGV